MRTLSLKWIALTVTGAATALAVSIATLPIELAIPVHQIELAWTLVRVLVEL